MGKEDLSHKIEFQLSNLIPVINLYRDHTTDILTGEEIFKYGKYLEANGFTLKECKVEGKESSFCAEYQSLSGGPVIGLLLGFDAGLNRNTGIISAVTAVVIKEKLGNCYPFKLVLSSMRTACNNYQNKSIALSVNDEIRGFDMMLSVYADITTSGRPHNPVAKSYMAKFKGKQAHAAAHPWDGRSAFDGLQMAFLGVEFMQKHFPRNVQIRYTLTDNGGTPVNVVSDYAAADFSICAAENLELEKVCQRFEKILIGAALITGTEVSFDAKEKRGRCSFETSKLYEEFFFSNEQVNNLCIERTTFSDGRDIINQVPCLCVKTSFDIGEDFSAVEKERSLHHAVVSGAQTLGKIAYDFITNLELLKIAQNIWLKKKEDSSSL